MSLFGKSDNAEADADDENKFSILINNFQTFNDDWSSIKHSGMAEMCSVHT